MQWWRETLCLLRRMAATAELGADAPSPSQVPSVELRTHARTYTRPGQVAMHYSGGVKGNYSYRFQAWCVLLPTADGFHGGWVVAQSKNARSSVSSSSVTKSGTVC